MAPTRSAAGDDWLGRVHRDLGRAGRRAYAGRTAVRRVRGGARGWGRAGRWVRGVRHARGRRGDGGAAARAGRATRLRPGRPDDLRPGVGGGRAAAAGRGRAGGVVGRARGTRSHRPLTGYADASLAGAAGAAVCRPAPDRPRRLPRPGPAGPGRHRRRSAGRPGRPRHPGPPGAGARRGPVPPGAAATSGRPAADRTGLSERRRPLGCGATPAVKSGVRPHRYRHGARHADRRIRPGQPAIRVGRPADGRVVRGRGRAGKTSSGWAPKTPAARGTAAGRRRRMQGGRPPNPGRPTWHGPRLRQHVTGPARPHAPAVRPADRLGRPTGTVPWWEQPSSGWDSFLTGGTGGTNTGGTGPAAARPPPRSAKAMLERRRPRPGRKRRRRDSPDPPGTGRRRPAADLDRPSTRQAAASGREDRSDAGAPRAPRPRRLRPRTSQRRRRSRAPRPRRLRRADDTRPTAGEARVWVSPGRRY